MLQSIVTEGIVPTTVVMNYQISVLARNNDRIIAYMVDDDNIAVPKIKHSRGIVAKRNAQVGQSAIGCQGTCIRIGTIGEIGFVKRAINGANGGNGIVRRRRRWQFVRWFDNGCQRSGWAQLGRGG